MLMWLSMVPTFSRTAPLGPCDSIATLEIPESVPADGGSQYKWDGTQYHYNWSTKGLAAGTYDFFWMAENDPTEHVLRFHLV